MKKKIAKHNFDNPEYMNQSLKPSIQKISFSPPGIDLNSNIYDTPSLESNISTFNVVNPGQGSGDAILASHNPCLLAISKKSKTTVRPKVKPNPAFPSPAQGFTSLLSKKPLSDLPEPKTDNGELQKAKLEMDETSFDSNENPISYFLNKGEDKNQLFIYMTYAKSRDDPNFSPYELTRIPFLQAGKNYFTMTASGITHIDEFGNTENFLHDKWSKDASFYKAIRKLKTFKFYFLWKPLRVWKNFVQQMHFKEKLSILLKNPLCSNTLLSKASIGVTSLLNRSDYIISNKLLCFSTQKKYLIDEFITLSDKSLQSLDKKYKKLMETATEIVDDLYQTIKDPKLLNVDDTEFREMKRKNPSITQLMLLEQKKENEINYRANKMKIELSSIADLTRMLDYILLETIRDSCYKSYIYADQAVSTDLSAVFTIEPAFSEDGDLIFKPSKNEMIQILDDTFKNAQATLEALPRLLKQTPARLIIKDAHLKMSELLANGPNLLSILESHPTIQNSINHIKDVISDAYDQSYNYSHSLISFYPLYQIGKNWDVRDFIKLRKGSKYTGTTHFYEERDPNESKENFLIQSEEQPVIDFETTEQIIEKFRNENKRLEDIRLGAIKGPLYIDSKKLKANLAPIPLTSLKSLETTFSDLVQSKITLLSSVFQSFSAQMKQEPNTLELYVSFSDMVQRTTDLLPQMTTEIHFIDRVVELFETANFAPIKNPLHSIFDNFKIEQKKAIQIKDNLYDKFTFVLKQLIKKKEMKIQQYKTLSQDIPITTKNIDFDAFLKQTLKYKNKCEHLEQPIAVLLYQQKVLGLQISLFPEFAELKQNIEFAEKIYQVTKSWDGLNNQISTIPFAHISMNEFKSNVDEIQLLLTNLTEMWPKPSPILSEIKISFNSIPPFLPQLLKLSTSKVQERHWKQLYELCGKRNGYSITNTIQNMIDSGILSHESVINEITTTSLGESYLETEFQIISAHWNEVTLPVIDPPVNTEDQLLLGDTTNLITDITNTSNTLITMLSNKYVSGIKSQVIELNQSMEHFMNILDQWQIFQGNWTTISSLFKQGQVRLSLPNPTTRYEVIRKKWISIIKHILSDKKMFEVCSYPTLLEDFIDNNKSLEAILESIGKYLDKKREAIPRFYLLSDEEVLTLISTNDLGIFTQNLTKVMMHIQRLDSHTSDQADSTPQDSVSEGCNFVGLKIFGVVGEDGDSLPFVNAIHCPGSIDIWVPSVFEMMEISMKDALTISLSRFASSPLTEWVMTVSSYISMLTLHIAFARDVEDCFNNLETNPKAFTHFEHKMKRQIQELVALMTTPLNRMEKVKISSVLNLLLSFYEKARTFQEKNHLFSQIEAWYTSVKFKYDAPTAEVVISFADKEWIRGKEYWGFVPRLIYTPSVEQALADLCLTNGNNRVQMVFGSRESGKTKLYEMFNCYLGKFCYVFSSYTNLQPFFIERVLISSILNGSALIFKNIDEFSLDNQNIIFDYTQKIRQYQQITIQNIDLNITQDVPIMFTATSNYQSGLIKQFHEFARPISLSIPNVVKIVETSLVCNGYKSAKSIALKLYDFTTATMSLFKMSQMKIKHMLTIIQDGIVILLQLINDIKVDKIDYIQDPKKAEQYSIARAAYNHFKVLCDPQKLDSILLLLYSAFHIFDDIDEFCMSIISPYKFYNDIASNIMRETVNETVSKLGYEIPVDYLLNQAQLLMEMMFSYSCIIIYGPPHSGKSLVLELLSTAFGAMIKDSVLLNHYRGLMPFKIETIYQQSDTFENIFGSITHNNELMNNQWSFGLFHSTLNYLKQFSKTNHRILKFDGLITPEMNQFICWFVSNQGKFRLNNLGTFVNDKSFHCIIETDDISNLSPTLINTCGFLLMDSVQSPPSNFSFTVDLHQPSIPFSFVQNEFGKKFTDLEYSKIKAIFCEVAPVVVRQFQIDLSLNCARFSLNYLLDNEIDCQNDELILIVIVISFYHCYCSYSSESHFEFSNWLINRFSLKIPTQWEEIVPEDAEEPSNDLVNEALHVIHEGTNEQEMEEAIQMARANTTLKDSQLLPESNQAENDTLNKNDDNNSVPSANDDKNSMLSKNSQASSNTKKSKASNRSRRSSRSSLTSFSNYSQTSLINTGSETKTLIQILKENFEKPSLSSIQIQNNRIVPIDLSSLNDRIIVEGTQFADDIIVPNVQHLSIFSPFKIAMKPQSHILLNGPINSGKNALLKYIFSKNENVCPIYFNSSIQHNSIQTIINTIKTETTLMSKTAIHTNKTKLYALIFDHLSPNNRIVIEFIRKLISEQKIVITSKIDPNLYNIIGINRDNYFVIVRSESINFDVRFLNMFYLLHTEEYTRNTQMYIVNRGMGVIGISIEMIHLLVTAFTRLKYTLAEMVTTFIQFANIKVSENDSIRVLMTSVYFFRFKQSNESEFDSFLTGLLSDKYPVLNEALKQFAEKKQFARVMQNVSSEVLSLDKEKVEQFMSKSLKTTIYKEQVQNFIQIDFSLGKLGNHCVIYSNIGTSQFTLIKLVAEFQGSILVEINDIESIKKFINDLVYDDGFHVHIIVIRNMHLIQLIIDIFVHNVFQLIFKEEDFIQLAQTMLNIHNPDDFNLNAKKRLLSKLKKLIRFNVRIVIHPDTKIDQNDNTVYDLLKLNEFEFIELAEPSKHSICQDLIKENSQQLEIVLTSISESIESLLPFSSITQFYDFVSTFAYYITGDMKNALMKNDEVIKALEFIDKIEIENTVYTEKLNQIQPDLEKLRIETETSRDAFNSKNDAISMRKLKLSEEKLYLSTELENKEEELKQAESDLKQLEPNVEIAFSHLKSLKSTDIDPIRITESDPCESLKLMLEAIAVLIGVPNTSYEAFGHALLMDEEFVEKIVQNVDYKKISQTTYDSLISYLNNPKLSRSILEAVAPVLITIRNFIEATCTYAARNFIYRDKKIDAEMMKRSLNDFISDMERELDSIHDIESLSVQEQDDLQHLQAQLNQIQKQYCDIEKQKKKIDMILEDSDRLKQIWTKQTKKVNNNGESLIGDSILLSVYIAYAGMLENDTRKALLMAAKSKMDESSLTSSFVQSPNTSSVDLNQIQEDLLFKVTSKLLSEATGLPDNVVLPRTALVDFRHIQITPKFPLLMDPDGYLIEMIQNDQATIVSLNSLTLNECIFESIRDGKYLIVTDVDEFNESIGRIISYAKHPSRQPISIDSKMVIKNDQFKVLFVTSLLEPEQIPIELQLRMTVINVNSSSSETIHNIIVHLFVNHFAPDLMPKIIELQKSELAHQVQVKQYENEALSIINEISKKEDFINDELAIRQLISVKNHYFEALDMEGSQINVKKELEDTKAPFNDLFTVIETIWMCLTRYMPKVKSRYRFKFTEYLSIVKSAFADFPIEINDAAIEKLRGQILTEILKWVFPMLTINDSIFFMFLSTFMLLEDNWDDLSEIITNLQLKLNSKITPVSIFQTGFFEKLKTCHICEFFDLVLQFIQCFFGNQFEQYYDIFNCNSILNSNQKITFIFSNGKGQIFDILSKDPTFESVSLRQDSNFTDLFNKMKKGQKILIHYSIPSKKSAQILNSLLSNSAINSPYKIIVNCYTDEYLSPYLLSVSNHLTVDDFPSIKMNMLKLFNSNEGLIQNTTQKLFKRFLYIGSLVYSQLRNRAFIKPLGFNNYFDLNQLVFDDYISYINDFIERYTSQDIKDPKDKKKQKVIAKDRSYDKGEMPIRNAREFVHNLIFSCTTLETQDRRRLRAIVSSFFTNLVFEENYNIVDQSNKNAALWAIPYDPSPALFKKQIMSLPLFNMTEPLMVNTTVCDPLMKWNLSRWLAKPFLSIANDIGDLDEEEEEEANEEEITGIFDLPNKQSSPLLQYWLDEINCFNNDIAKGIEEARHDKKWKYIFNTTDDDKKSQKEFRQFLAAKRLFLIDCYEKVVINQINLKFVENPRGFFISYKLHYCLLHGKASDSVAIEFDCNDDGDVAVAITGLAIFNGFILAGNLLPLGKQEKNSFAHMSPIFMKFSQIMTRSGTFSIPVLKTVLPEMSEIHEEETDNFIIDIEMNIQKGDRMWLLNSTSFYIFVPHIFFD